jgi:hypothetical protein
MIFDDIKKFTSIDGKKYMSPVEPPNLNRTSQKLLHAQQLVVIYLWGKNRTWTKDTIFPWYREGFPTAWSNITNDLQKKKRKKKIYILLVE